jgi:hypothetical protein
MPRGQNPFWPTSSDDTLRRARRTTAGPAHICRDALAAKRHTVSPVDLADLPMTARPEHRLPLRSRYVHRVIGKQPLNDDVDRVDVEELLTAAPGSIGEVTGAGTGRDFWHLDVEVLADAGRSARVAERLAAALVGQGLGW